jgi:soluble lytic murein transglycosylase
VKRRRTALLGLALVVLGCTSAQGPEPTPSLRVPLALNGPQAGPKQSSSPREPLGEERFAPWLTRPGLERVAEAAEADDVRRATLELDRWLAANPPPARDAASLSLLAALFHERAADAVGALAAYERAADPSFALAPFASAGRARVLLSLGRATEALAVARALPDLPCLAAARNDLLADAAFAAGERAVGLDALRQRVKSASSARDRATPALRLARELLAGPKDVDGGASLPDVASLLESLAVARRVQSEAAGLPDVSKKANELVTLALAALPESVRAQSAEPEPAQVLANVESLVDGRRNEEALALAEKLSVRLKEATPGSAASGDALLVCRLELARAKAYAQRRDRARAFDAAVAAAPRCQKDPDLHARALYNAGKYAAADGRHSEAVRYFARVESEHHAQSLADDARLQAALSYLELGVEARFTELLRSMPDEYPRGDMTVEGVFRLAVRRIDKGDWSGAAAVLARAVALVGSPDADAARGSELAGRERYFQARAALALGQRSPALDAFETIVREQPLSYYMLHAYVRLRELDVARASRALAEALDHAQHDSLPRPPESLDDDTGFVRALELFRVGEIAPAVAELDALGLTRPGAGPELLWGVARLYSAAGAERLAHDVARRRLTDWLLRWPAGDWLEAWRIAYPEPYGKMVDTAAKHTGLEKPMIYAIMREESAFDPDAESPADAYGLMQLIVPTARAAAKGTTLPHDRHALKRPSVNIELGCRTLARYAASFPDNALLSIPAYNAGPSKVHEWLRARPSTDFDVWVELIPFLETRRYTKRVLASRATYAFLADPAHPELALELPKRVKE